jgi:hypothetical protein
VDSITESINKGNIYKFFLKPWNDQNLKLEIVQALKQFELIRINNNLHRQVLEQNAKLKEVNENLEGLVRERTRELEIQNQALEISHAILEGVPIPVIGVGADGMIAVLNEAARSLRYNDNGLQIGKKMSDYFPSQVQERVKEVMDGEPVDPVLGWEISQFPCDVSVSPLSGRFRGQGVVLTLKPQTD